MILNYVDIQNFMSIQQVRLPLHNQGFMLLTGENLDNPALNNNGSGKSSLIEAIVYALYGKTLRGVRGDLVVNRTANKDMRVELELIDDDGTKYNIIRHRKHTKYKNKSLLYQNDVNITPKSEADFDEYIVRLLQADFTIFTASVLYSAESFKMSTASDSEIKKALDTLLGLELLSTSHDVSKKRLQDVQKDIQLNSRSIQDKQSQIKRTEQKIQELQDKQLAFITQKQQKLQYLEQSIAVLEEKDDMYHGDLKKLQDLLQVLQDKYSDVSSQHEQLKQTLSQLDDLKDALAKATQRITEIKSEMTSVDKDCDMNYKLLTDAKKRVTKYKREISQLQSQIDSAESKVGTPCITCGQTLTQESIQSVIAEFASKQTALQEQIDEETTGIYDTKSAIAACETKLDALDAELKTALQHQKDLQNQADSSDMKLQLDALDDELGNIQKHVYDTKNDINYKQLQIKQTNDSIRELNRQLRDTKSEENHYEGLIESLKEEIQNYQSEVQSLQGNNAELMTLEKRLKFWSVAYSNQGIKSYILDDVTPFLNTKLNKYLSKLASGQIEATFSTQTELKSGEKREKFSLEILNSGDGQYNSNSAGEKKRIDLAINLALQDLVASRSSKKLNIALFDEVFDSLDDRGIDAVIGLLYSLMTEKSTILLITHNEHLKSYFTKCLTIVKQNGMSNLA